MKKNHLLGLSMLTVIVVATFIGGVWWTSPRVDQAAFDEINVAMSRSEVETIFNCPGRKWLSIRGCVETKDGPTHVIEWLDASHFLDHNRFRHYAWMTDKMLITIVFDENDRVFQKSARSGSFDVGFFASFKRAVVFWQ